MNFPERIGAVRRELQKDSMNEALRNSLWNVMYEAYWKYYAHISGQVASEVREGMLLHLIWANQLDLPADEATLTFPYLLKQVKQRYMAAEWWAVYSFVEFVVDFPRPKEATAQFVAACNAVLEKHVSAFRFVRTKLAPITSEEEITAVEHAMSHGDRFKPAVAHLKTALARFADRSSPDYRNSIKESISAVEAVCQIITGDSTLTLGKALK
jgi:hypothetical protein